MLKDGFLCTTAFYTSLHTDEVINEYAKSIDKTLKKLVN